VLVDFVIWYQMLLGDATMKECIGALRTKLPSCYWSARRRSAILSLLLNSRRVVWSLGTLYLFFSGRRSHAP
jgi:hypothetical protein